jgi:hypothetical protein
MEGCGIVPAWSASAKQNTMVFKDKLGDRLTQLTAPLLSTATPESNVNLQ